MLRSYEPEANTRTFAKTTSGQPLSPGAATGCTGLPPPGPPEKGAEGGATGLLRSDALYYGIGEVKQVVGSYVAVDFRGTGLLGVHEDVLSEEYLIPIPPATLPLL